MVLAFEPQHVSLPAAGGTASGNTIKNEGVARMAFKIKSSNNAHYRVKPVYGFVDANASVAVEIVRQAGPPGEDKMVVQFAEVPPEETNPKAPFQAGACQGEVIITLVATA
uniref:MSP domain-containing protein n=1 Tax=Panagrolaimus sp. PS1159 TaxID=55785 RepID=A0AC35FY17_9BILA